ncbi:MAG: putative Ig domain-containing protein, partial [Candidatus Thermoplasmatota archaeon]|nr:putative Ig domain-containing protein [Candidatus Thermoplasmatota archaeon]
MIDKFGAVLIIGILMSSAFVFLDTDATGERTRLQVDTSAYRLAPLEEITTTMEDEVYRSIYFSMMGGMTVNSFATDAHWLTWEYTEALTMNMTGNKGFWSFDQADASDSSGNNNHGTLYGPTTVGGISNNSQALSFDGDDYVSIPHDDTLNISDEITLEAWIYPTFDDSSEHMILSKGGNWNDEDPQCYELTMDRDRPLFQIKIAGSNDWYGAAPAEPISKNTWHHIAGVYDGSRFCIYVDGVNQTRIYNGWGGDYKGNVYTGGLPTSNHNISIGRRAPASWGSLFFEGYIDDVRIWDRAIPGKEIREHAVIPGTRCLDLSGTPDNGDVKDHNVVINVTDGEGRYNEHSFTLTVENSPPHITSDDLLEIHQDEEYSVQYTSDETAGDTAWGLDTDVMWLSLDASGVLSGTPTNDDVGTQQVTVIFYDGNGGSDTTVFDLEVIDVNDPPRITTDGQLTATEDEYYYVEYEGDDPDGEVLIWSMVSDADWLSMDPNLGILSGTPANDDVGVCEVNITASDPRGLSRYTAFQLEVLNVNDAPTWVDVPVNTSVREGDSYRFDINATDVDLGDVLTYDVITFPVANISLNTSTGVFEWITTRSIFLEQDHTLDLMVKVTDGEETISGSFHLNLILDPSPTTTLIAPLNQTRVGTTTILKWEGEDESPLAYDVYLGQMMSNVLSLRETSRIAERMNETEFTITDLEEGETYYWTVIAKDEYSTGTCINKMFSFLVNVPPVTRLEYPSDGEMVSCNDLALEYVGSDLDKDAIEYHLYISTEKEDVQSRADSVHHLAGPTFMMDDVQPGVLYYWTVIAKDDHTFGTCTDGIYSFTVNIPPIIDTVEDLQVPAGSEILVDVNVTDEDQMDTFEFSLLDGPTGMTIVSNTGVISWIPEITDIGTYTIRVQFSDGLDQVNISFNIEVLEVLAEEDEGDGGSSSGAIIIAGIAVVIVLIGALVIFLLIKKRGKGKEVEEPRPEIEESENIPNPHPLLVGSSIIEKEGSPNPPLTEPGNLLETAPLEPTLPPSLEPPEVEVSRPETPPPTEQGEIPVLLSLPVP